MSDQKKITPKQHRGLVALMAEPTMGRAAAAAGVNEITIRRWLKQPHFQEALATAEAQAIAEAARSLSAASREAVEYLRQVLRDDNISPGEKIRAALGLLSALPPVRVLGAIEARVDLLLRSQQEGAVR